MSNSSAVRRFLDLVSGKNPALKRFDWPIAYWVTTIVLVLAVVGTVLDALDINLTWNVTYSPESGLHGARTASVKPVADATVDVKTLVPDLQQKLPQGMTARGELPVSVAFDNSTLRSQVLNFLSSIPMDLLVVALIWLLRRIVLTTVSPGLSSGDPFIKANVWRLRIMASLVLVMPLVSFWSEVAVWELVSPSASKDLLWMSYDASLLPLQLGGAVVLFILADVFSAGVRLRDDVEGLV